MKPILFQECYWQELHGSRGSRYSIEQNFLEIAIFNNNRFLLWLN
jgi:hypothetical protein